MKKVNPYKSLIENHKCWIERDQPIAEIAFMRQPSMLAPYLLLAVLLVCVVLAIIMYITVCGSSADSVNVL